MNHLSNYQRGARFLEKDSRTLNSMSAERIVADLERDFEELFPDPLGAFYAALLIKERVKPKKKTETSNHEHEPNASPFLFTEGEIVAIAEEYNALINGEVARCRGEYSYLCDWDFQEALKIAFIAGTMRDNAPAKTITASLEPLLKRRCRHRDRYPEDYGTIAYLSNMKEIEIEPRIKNLLYVEIKKLFIATLSSRVTLRGAENMDDLFQDSVIVLQNNIDRKRFRIHKEWLLGLTCAVTSFLISVGKNMAFKKLYKEKNTVVSDLESVGDIPAEDESLLERLYRDIRVIILGELLNELEEKMKKDDKHINQHTLIMLTHFDDSNDQALIAKMLGYKSAEVVKVTLHRVHRKLKKRLEEELLKRDLGLLSQKELIEKFFGDLNDA